MADAPRPERADAAANRRRILRAAADLFAAGSPVTMDDIARAAGVGRATLYRRYASVGLVAEALLDDAERTLQAQILRGPPPLGPGASAASRMGAFYEAMVRLLDQHAGLVLATEVGQARYRTGAYGFWRMHVLHLLRDNELDDADILADLLLAPLDPGLFLHQREQGVAPAKLAASLRRIAEALL